MLLIWTFLCISMPPQASNLPLENAQALVMTFWPRSAAHSGQMGHISTFLSHQSLPARKSHTDIHHLLLCHFLSKDRPAALWGMLTCSCVVMRLSGFLTLFLPFSLCVWWEEQEARKQHGPCSTMPVHWASDQGDFLPSYLTAVYVCMRAALKMGSGSHISECES